MLSWAAELYDFELFVVWALDLNPVAEYLRTT
jgi:hypothetical protein